MKFFEITNYYNGGNSLLKEGSLLEAQNGRKALDVYLKENNISAKVKVSGGNDVHFCVTPIVYSNGVKCIDGSRRKMWYRVID
ncbi:hypothetical protein [uncultured Mediterranean phage]|nr:hypothetical protein [uncultured Mediterranean phage]